MGETIEKKVESKKEPERKSEYKNVPIIEDKKTKLPLYRAQRELEPIHLIPVGNVKEFFKGLSDGKILATRCKNCGKIYFPPQKDCPVCMAEDMEWIELSRNAKLITFAEVNVKPTGFKDHPDYIIGVGELDEGIRVLAWVEAKNISELKIGDMMKLEVRKMLPEGYLTYTFIPA